MDSQSTTTEIKHHYPPTTPWSSSSRVSSASSTPGHKSLPDKPASYQPQSHLDLLPILFPQHYQAQLLNYNRLISPGRGGGGGLTTPPLPPVVSAPHIQAAPRARSVSKASNKDSQNGKPSGASSNCHGSRVNKNADKSDRAVTMAKDKTSKVPPKQGDTAQSLSARPLAHRASQNAPTQTSSVPSTPHQHARNHSIFPESHETSPTATQNHSPRSAYSETNSTLPSLRPLPPRLGGCKFETALVRGRRRMPYSLGTDRLEKSDLGKIKSKLSEDEERKLTTDMRELYDRLKPTEESRQNRNQFVSKLEKIFNEEWPGHNIGVHLFGSSGNKLYSDDSDVDICITTDWKDLENVCMIAELLAKRGMEKVVCVSSAKVPIVKIWDPELKLACDMNVNNTLALENTRMVLTYVEIDERVRPLAMIIKHWTRRRIINDAAFGGTLSSYTWICMIICFLQLRKPPVLPALHQRPHQKRPAANGRQSEFADDLNKLRGFGKENKETLGELLFHFFKFYAHEFDYDKLALSVRLGKTITKTEKEWHRSINNMLCVEEPFNTVRNLGNTADDTSFRGLHMELRRAYELISEAKFDECCEQYVFPKEEERIWQKPASAPRPILLRSSSQQQQTGRSGRGNYRGGRQFHRNGNNNRRASSSVAYENNPVYTQTSLPIMTPQDLQWYQGQAPNGHYPLHGDIINSALSALQIQEQTLRFQLYTQYTHSQAYAQQQALQHAQRMQGGASSQSGDRSRTNSFDNPPLTAPIRPELYMYPMAVQQAPYFTHAGQGTSFTTYPSSPSTTNGAPEFRRSLHRSSVATDASAPSSTGTLRSQSQPASRSSMPSIPMIPGYPGITGPNGMPVYPTRHASGGGPLPSFIPDESGDSETEAGQTGAITESPTEEESTRYVGYYVTETTPTQQTMPIPNAIPPFADVGQGRRRLSTDQLPQTILDRRMRRASRSPSPLGHSRAFSMGTNSAPLSSAPFAPVGNTLLKEPQKPIVVNGTLGGSARQPSVSGSVASEDIGPYDNPLHISQSPSVNGSSFEQAGSFPASGSDHSPPYPDRPLVVNGSSSASATPQTPQDYQSFNQRMAYMGFTPSPYGVMPGPALNGMTQVSPMSRQRAVSRQQQNGIAPLDLAVADHFSPEMQHLSPVYETRTPSPTVTRRFDGQATNGTPTPVPAGGHQDGQLHKDTPKSQQKTSPTEMHAKNEHQSHHGHQKHHPRVNGIASRENGHVRAAKSESDHASGWQKPKSRRKGGDAKNAASNQSHGETPPKNDAERKGG